MSTRTRRAAALDRILENIWLDSIARANETMPAPSDELDARIVAAIKATPALPATGTVQAWLARLRPGCAMR